MKAGMKRISLVLSAVGCALAAAADNAKWKGTDGAALNDAANWDGAAPFAGVSANGMLFGKGAPSDDYTVRLDGDLVCAGPWAYEDGPYRVTYDLGGHALTFLSPYSGHLHRGVTNVVRNGTIAFTNAAGAVQNVNVWHSKSGYALFVEGTGGFVGNLAFSDSGTKYLTVRDGGSYRGALDVRGAACQVALTGEGTTIDVNGGRFNVGGAGWGARGLVADGACVSNVGILNVGGVDSYGAVGGARLVVSNATLECATASGVATVGSGYVRDGGEGVLQSWSAHENELRLVDGAYVDLKNRGFYVGPEWGSASNCLYVAGEGTVLTNAGDVNGDTPLIAGQAGDFNAISVTDGARVYAGAISAGGQRKNFCSGRATTAVTSRWNRVTVEKGAMVEAGTFVVGTRHSDDLANGSAAAAVTVSNVFAFVEGGKGAARAVRVGMLPAAQGNRFVVSGAGTEVALTGGATVSVGYDGSAGNGVEVLDGGVLAGVCQLNVGSEVHYKGTDEMGTTASNNYVRIEGADVALAGTPARVNLGGICNGGNRLWVGAGATLKAGGLVVRGWGQEVVVSNGTLNVGAGYAYSDGLRIGYEEGTVALSGGLRLSFFGASPRLVLASRNDGPFTNACALAFHVPEGGYAAAPLESTVAALRFSDDTAFSFDLSGIGAACLRNVPLVRYSGSNPEESRIVLPDALLAKIRAAATAAHPRARVEFSEDARLLTLSVPSGTLLIVR